MESPRFEMDGALPRRVIAPCGTPLVWREAGADDRLRLVLRLPDHREVALELDAAEHPVLGRVDRVLGTDRELLTVGTAIDWDRPIEIPALARPAALPPGAGTAILGLLAWQAERASSGPLRYHGPYPSHALWHSLRSSFRVDDPRGDGEARFTADAHARALAGTRAEIPIDFHPAPFRWHWPQPRVCVQAREQIERVYIDGHAYDRDSTGPRTLHDAGDGLSARVQIGLQLWVEVLALSSGGEPQGSIRPLPRAPADLLDTPLPEPVVQVLREVLVAQAPPGLRAAMDEVLENLTMVWGDTAPALVSLRARRLVLHASLIAALPTDASALLGALVQLVEPPLRGAAASRLAAAWSSAELSTARASL